MERELDAAVALECESLLQSNRRSASDLLPYPSDERRYSVLHI